MSLELDRSAKLFDRPSWLPITADEATPTSRQQALQLAARIVFWADERRGTSRRTVRVIGVGARL